MDMISRRKQSNVDIDHALLVLAKGTVLKGVKLVVGI